jgi:hypothetical protein
MNVDVLSVNYRNGLSFCKGAIRVFDLTGLLLLYKNLRCRMQYFSEDIAECYVD